MDVTEHDKDISVTAELPGIDPKDVQIDLDDDMLTIRREKRSDETGGDGGRRTAQENFGETPGGIDASRNRFACDTLGNLLHI